jgi:hypothetical protein
MASVLNKIITSKPIALNSGIAGKPVYGQIQNGVLKPVAKPDVISPVRPVATPSVTRPPQSGLISNPLPTTTPIPIKQPINTGVVGPVIKTATPIDQIKDIAASATPTDIQKGVDLLASGNGVLTPAQKAIQSASTSPAMLPKTKALKEAEYIATLPQTSKSETMDAITGNNYMLYGGVALLVVIILIFALKK